MSHDTSVESLFKSHLIILYAISGVGSKKKTCISRKGVVEACKNLVIWLDSSMNLFAFHQWIFPRQDREGKWHFVYVTFSIELAIVLWVIWKILHGFSSEIISETSQTLIKALAQHFEQKKYCIKRYFSTKTR